MLRQVQEAEGFVWVWTGHSEPRDFSGVADLVQPPPGFQVRSLHPDSHWVHSRMLKALCQAGTGLTNVLEDIYYHNTQDNYIQKIAACMLHNVQHNTKACAQLLIAWNKDWGWL